MLLSVPRCAGVDLRTSFKPKDELPFSPGLRGWTVAKACLHRQHEGSELSLPHATALTMARMATRIETGSLGQAARQWMVAPTCLVILDYVPAIRCERQLLGIDRPRLGMVKQLAKVQEVLLRGGSL